MARVTYKGSSAKYPNLHIVTVHLFFRQSHRIRECGFRTSRGYSNDKEAFFKH